jgi:flagellar biosynthesis/type III secretory pathway M-ring protein FliF/YscJ
MKLKMSLKNILLIFVIAFFSVIILWNLACAFGYVREGMEHKHNEEDEDEDTEENDNEEDDNDEDKKDTEDEDDEEEDSEEEENKDNK